MPKNKDAERKEKLFDALLKVALEEDMEQEFKEFLNSEELNSTQPPSPAMQNRFKEIINRPIEESRGKKASRIFFRVAASFAIFFTIGTIVLMSVEASRVFILNTIISIYDDHVAFDFGELGRANENENGNGTTEFVPTGFFYVSSQHLETVSIFIFSNEKDERLILQRNIGTTLGMAVDNENRDFQKGEIDGNELHIFEALSDGYAHVIMWEEREYVYKIISSIGINQLFDVIAEFFSK